MTKHPTNPITRLVAAILPKPPAPPAPQPEEEEIEPTVKNVYPFVKYGD